MTDTAAEEMEARLRDGELRNVVLEFADVNGISRSKQVSVDYFLDSWRDGFSIPIAILATTPLTVPAAGSGITDDLHYADGYVHPDPATFKVVPWRDRTARVLCEFSFEGEPVGCDPRHVLGRTLDRIDLDLDVSVGSELEFYLLDPAPEGDGWVPATPHEHECVTWAMEEADGFYAQLADWAADYDVPLDLLQHEYGHGQFEVLFDYGPPRAQADLAFDFKRLVQMTARDRGQRATFMAKPYADQSGSGYHVHVGATDGGDNAFADGDGLSETGRQFVGGVLEHADALVALQCPTINAYKRFEPGGFVPYTASWGFDNRMAGVRVPIDEPRVEVRFGSADANPYVVIASTLAAGAHGLHEGIEPGDPIDDRDPAGDRPTLPRTPELAVRALEDDDVLADALGEEFVRAYAAVRRQGIEDFRDVVTDYEFETFGEMY